MKQKNRLPVVFPISFITSQINSGGDCGSDVVAGIVWENWFPSPSPLGIEIHRKFKIQQTRLDNGASLNEIEPWYFYTLRHGSAHGTDFSQWFDTYIHNRHVIKYMLTVAAEGLSIEQRERLLHIYSKLGKIRELYHISVDARSMKDDPPEEVTKLLTSHGIEAVPGPDTKDAILNHAHADDLILALTCIYFRELYEEYVLEPSKFQEEIQEVLGRFEQFEWETFSWPERE